jgi:hypothetical protein
MWLALRPNPPGLELIGLGSTGSGGRTTWLDFATGLGAATGGCELSVAAPHAMHLTAPTTLRKSHEGHTTANVRVSRATMRDS